MNYEDCGGADVLLEVIFKGESVKKIRNPPFVPQLCTDTADGFVVIPDDNITFRRVVKIVYSYEMLPQNVYIQVHVQ